MLISERFSEYGITGAFFWVIQLIIILIISEHPLVIWSTWMSQIDPFFSAIPDVLKVSIAGVLAVLGTMAIFVAGLLLDLMGSYYTGPEMFIFRHQVEKNREWLSSFVNKNRGFIGKDYDEFLSHPEDYWKFQKDHWKFQKEMVYFGFRNTFPFRILRILKKKSNLPKPTPPTYNSSQFVEPYNRLQSLLISYISIYSGTSNLDVYYDQMHFWRTARAVSIALLLFGLELFLAFSVRFLIAAIVKLREIPFNQDQFTLFTWGTLNMIWLFIYAIIFIFSAYISVVIARKSYSRMCSTLFALVYSMEEPHRENRQQDALQPQ
jgi:hypothetical protein